ncbi:hypothetical protein ACHAWF_005218 [Thalassiosira exigua]
MKSSSPTLASGALLLASSAVGVAAFSPATSARSANISPASSASSSTTRLSQFAGTMQQTGLVNIHDEYSPRDVYAMEQWAQQCGAQKAPGVELYSEDGSDYQYVAQQGASAGQTVLYVPSDIVLDSANIQQEFGTSLQQAEEAVVQIDQASMVAQGAQFRLPLFRLMMKILVEYEKGQDSFWYTWLNSLPRTFYNGVSMTKACTTCLPPYAGWLASNERINYSHFAAAVRRCYVPLSRETINDKKLVRWAYNVALTRFHEAWRPSCERSKLIGPLADMLNHAAEPNCEIVAGDDGSVTATALFDVPPGAPLTVSLGDPTNPTPIFAQYGFLPDDCATIFCKAMHLELWDVFLYEILQNNDPGAAQQFYVACVNNDEATKQQYLENYFQYTLDSLKQHVYGIMADCEQLTMRAQSYDVNEHPRVPVIVAHNQLGSRTFAMTAALLEQMG